MSDATRRVSVRLSVDGAQQARRELMRTGEAGEHALGRIVTVARRASSALDLLGIGLGAISVGALAAFTRRAIDTVGGLGELADQFGVSTDALQAFRFAAVEVGLRNEDLDRGLAALTRRIAEAATGERAAEQAFRQLGVAFIDAAGNARATEGVLADIADRVAAVESPAERARIATGLFGNELGQRLIPFLLQGRQGLERLTGEALRYGAIADAELIAKADEASDRIAKLERAFGTLATNLAARVAPALLAVVDALGQIIAQTGAADPVDPERGLTRVLHRIAELERQRQRLLDRARELGVPEQTALARHPRLRVINLEMEELRRQEQILQERLAAPGHGVSIEQRAQEIIEGRVRAGANEAELRRQRAAEDIAGLRETFDARLRIEREYQERLERIRRAAEAEAVDPAERQRLEIAALGARDEALARLTRTTITTTGAEERRIDVLRRQIELAGLADERERFVAERVAGLAGAQREETERLAATLFDLQQARSAETTALQEAGRLYEETRTPLERYTAALERLGELRPVLEGRFGAEVADEIIGRRAQRLFDELDRAEQQTTQVDDVARQLGLTFESAFENAIVRGQGVSDVLKGIEQDLLRLGTRKLVTEPLLALLNSVLAGFAGGGGIGGLFAGLGSFLAGLFHDGGTVGTSAVPTRRVPALAFAGAPRLHDGWFRPDEYPAILQRGEVVVPKREARRGFGPANVVINITTPDAESFRASQGQIAAAMARSLQRAQRSL